MLCEGVHAETLEFTGNEKTVFMWVQGITQNDTENILYNSDGSVKLSLFSNSGVGESYLFFRKYPFNTWGEYTKVVDESLHMLTFERLDNGEVSFYVDGRAMPVLERGGGVAVLSFNPFEAGVYELGSVVVNGSVLTYDYIMSNDDLLSIYNYGLSMNEGLVDKLFTSAYPGGVVNNLSLVLVGGSMIGFLFIAYFAMKRYL